MSYVFNKWLLGWTLNCLLLHSRHGGSSPLSTPATNPRYVALLHISFYSTVWSRLPISRRQSSSFPPKFLFIKSFQMTLQTATSLTTCEVLWMTLWVHFPSSSSLSDKCQLTYIRLAHANACTQGLPPEVVGASSMFTGEEEIFAFARACSRLVQMGSREWAESAGQ